MGPQVIIVGGGISGLTCAYYLKRRGYEVLLLERGRRIGGVMWSERRGGFLTEYGPNSFQSAPEIMQLIDELKLTDQLVTAPSSIPRYVYHGGRLHAFPMNPFTFLSTSLLSFRDKVKIFLEPWAPPPPGHEESIAEFVTRRFGQRVLETLVDPFVSGVYAGDPARLSLSSTFPSLAELEKTYGSVLKGLVRSRRDTTRPRPKRLLCSFRDGLKQLPQALAEQLGDAVVTGARTIRLETVTSMMGPPYRLTIEWSAGIDRVRADAIVLATPAYVAADLVRSLSSSLAEVLETIEYPPLAVLCLGYDEADFRQPLDGFGFLVPRRQGIRLLGCLWNSSLFPGRAPEGKVCLTCFVGGTTDPGVRQLSDEQLVGLVRDELQLILGVRAEPYVVAIHRHDRAIPQYHLGHQAKLHQMEEHLGRLPGLFLVGNYLRGVSVSDCVREARKTAERLDSMFPA
ncbi:MAG: protoporphyrinogen oxidase [Acidobacteria bacterium]|nr:MAG: protoporphyrinogen oxidase [Acidobacteriota bacterium]